MRGVIVSLFVFSMFVSLVSAGGSSSVRTDFYIQGEGADGGYTEESYVVEDSPSNNNLLYAIYTGILLIAIAIVLRLIKEKPSKSKVSKKKVSKKKVRKARKTGRKK